jgi:hypothetical protein
MSWAEAPKLPTDLLSPQSCGHLYSTFGFIRFSIEWMDIHPSIQLHFIESRDLIFPLYQQSSFIPTVQSKAIYKQAKMKSIIRHASK